jgi:hypothetical protein
MIMANKAMKSESQIHATQTNTLFSNEMSPFAKTPRVPSVPKKGEGN